MKQDHKPLRKMDICPKFCKSNVKHCTVLKEIYNDKMNTMEQESTNFFDEHFI